MKRSTSVTLFLSVSLCAAVAFGPRLAASGPDTRIADAVMNGDRSAALALMKQGADVNGAQGDGMTALHWAAMKNDLDVAKALIAAKANLNAPTRINQETPIFFASRNGDAQMLIALLFAGADAKLKTTTGLTPLMVAAAGGNPEAVKLLIGFGGDVNIKESSQGQTALMFAASFNRAEAVRILMDHGADSKIASRVIDMAAQAAAGRGGGGGAGGGRAGGGGAAGAPAGAGPGRAGGRGAAAAGDPAAAGTSTATAQAQAAGLGGATTVGGPGRGTIDPAQAAQAGAGAGRGGGRGGRGGGGAAAADGSAQGQDQQGGGGNNNGDDSRPTVIDFQGGLTPLLFAARQGHLDAVKALVECGASINVVSPGDKTSPLLMATINGHFDVAMYLLSKGADPNLASTANAGPLYGALNVQYAPHAFYPQPSPARDRTTLIELMSSLLEHGADPNVRLRNKLWYTGYNFDQSGVDAKGSTPFWRAAQAADIDAMKLLLAYGADPTIPSEGGAARGGNGRGPSAAVADAHVASKILGGVSPLQMTSGAGYDGNFQVIAPGGFLPAFKFLLETIGGDVNEADSRGYTPVHNAAFRGDNEMIQYLVSKGADVKIETSSGDTAVDLANGPVQRLQPFPETIKLLEGMGVKNNNRCKSCG